jgi:Na+/proline symporter
VIYRYRQTRAMTLAQFFEMRYSRRFRVFAGLVAFVSGIINYGIFPAVAARFFIALCGLPDAIMIGETVVSTFPLLMGFMLAVALLFVFIGGQVAVIVTDFIQGSFANVIFLVVIAYLLWLFPWSRIETALLAAPEGNSLVDPFDLGREENFNPWYWVISVIVLFYGMMGWQGESGYRAAALNAHEAKMANIFNGWRFRVLMLITLVLPVAIRVVMTDPAYAAEADLINAYTSAQPTAALAAEVRTPVAVSQILPAGLLGLFAAALLGAFISTNDTYLHSWGSIFIQDVVLPFRKKPLSQRAHLLLLKCSIFGVAIFAFVFSLLYTPNQYIAMFLALTGAVFVGGAGSAIIGGLYWKRGTTAAAWAAMIAGMTLSGGGIILKQLDASVVHPGPILVIEHGDSVEELLLPLDRDDDAWSPVGDTSMTVDANLLEPEDGASAARAAVELAWGEDRTAGQRAEIGPSGSFTGTSPDGKAYVVRLEAPSAFAPLLAPLAYVRNDLTGQVLTFWSILISILLYVSISLLGWASGREPHDMDKLLNRGVHAIKGDQAEIVSRGTWLERFGFDSAMTRWDRFATAITLLWPLGFTIVFIVILIWHKQFGLTREWWAGYWHWWTYLAFGVATVVTVWFTIGGIRDLRRMFDRLRNYVADDDDDGHVA